MDTTDGKIKILSAAPYFYNISRDVGYTVRYIIVMDESIDGDALKKAFETTMTRYPYFRLKLVRKHFSDHLEYNDAPLVVLNTSKALTLGGDQTNGHLLALSYCNNVIYINNSHGIADGRGRGPFMKTLMYYYCTYRYNEQVEMDNVNLAGSPIDPAETEDPFVRFKSKLSLHRRYAHPPKIMQLSKMGLVTKSNPVIHSLSIDEKVLMDWCKANNATPNVAMCVLMGRAIRKLHSDTGQKAVTCGVYCDLRKTLNAPKSHWSLVVPLPLIFGKRMDGLDIKAQCTILRGELLFLSSPNTLEELVSLTKIGVKAVYYLPKFLKHLIFKRMFHIMDAINTFNVSYTGKVSYGSCDKHIKALFSAPNCGLEILMEVTVADGHFLLNIAQLWQESVYIDAFMKELADNGISFEHLCSRKQDCTQMEI